MTVLQLRDELNKLIKKKHGDFDVNAQCYESSLIDCAIVSDDGGCVVLTDKINNGTTN